MLRLTFGFLVGLALTAAPATSQLSGLNFRGDWGLNSGTQPAPHLYFAPVYSRYSTNSIRDSDGDVRPNVAATIDLDVVAAFLWWVTDLKVLGANYGAQLSLPWVGAALEAPGLGVGVDNDLGFADLYLQPINLGWHRDRADFMVGAGVYIPTGRWELGARNNRGLGMWGFDLVAGSTVYLNRARTLTVSALAAWETHRKKKDTDVKVGDLLTVEGGLGAAFLDGGLNVGAAYFFQWKLTSDDLGIEALPRLDKSRSYGIGPEASLAIPYRGRLLGILTARYLWDYGVRSTTEGETFVAMLTVPIPSLSLDGGS